MSANYVSAIAPTPAASKRDKIIVIAVVAVVALVVWAMSDFILYTSLTATYRKEVSAQITALDGVMGAMRKADDTFGEAAKQLPAAEAALSELRSLTPPRGAKEFHALLIETLGAYVSALDMIADVGGNPFLALSLAPSIRERTDFYHANLERLDFANLRIKY